MGVAGEGGYMGRREEKAGLAEGEEPSFKPEMAKKQD